jgi:hypothetical protein
MSDISISDIFWMICTLAFYRLGWHFGYDQRDREEFAKNHPWFRRYL